MRAFVACSNAYASSISFGSLLGMRHAMELMLTGDHALQGVGVTGADAGANTVHGQTAKLVVVNCLPEMPWRAPSCAGTTARSSARRS